ncbi:MAG: hypothetical protein HC877_17675 [Thioploca sp.]|nr:hypothetical protein [Thioploca sp.]
MLFYNSGSLFKVLGFLSLATLNINVNCQTTASNITADVPQEPTVTNSSHQNSDIATFQVYKDPVTGKFGPPPADAPSPSALSDQLMEYTSTSTEGLEEINTGNGYMIDLQSRFQELVTFSTGNEPEVTSAKE